VHLQSKQTNVLLNTFKVHIYPSKQNRQ